MFVKLMHEHMKYVCMYCMDSYVYEYIKIYTCMSSNCYYLYTFYVDCESNKRILIKTKCVHE